MRSRARTKSTPDGRIAGAAPHRQTLAQQIMQEHIQLPGVPQIIVTRVHAYQWLKQCGMDANNRGFGSLDHLVFRAAQSSEPLSDMRDWQPFLDAVEAELTGKVICWASGKLHLPKIGHVARYVIPPGELPAFTHSHIGTWLHVNDEALRVIYDWSATAPDGTVVPWNDEEHRQHWLDSLG